MRTISLKPALQYSLRDALRSTGIYLFVILCIYCVFTIPLMIFDMGGTSAMSGMDTSAIIFCFVVGIVSVREDLRFFIQNGCSRRTTYLAQLAVAFCVALVVTLGSQILLVLFRYLTAALANNVSILSFYEASVTGGAASFFASIGFMMLCCLPATTLGMLISLIYYRLSKGWKVAFSIGVPGLLSVALPIFLAYPIGQPLARALSNLVAIIFASVGSVCVSLAIATLLVAALSYLLIRKAPIK